MWSCCSPADGSVDHLWNISRNSTVSCWSEESLPLLITGLHDWYHCLNENVYSRGDGCASADLLDRMHPMLEIWADTTVQGMVSQFSFEISKDLVWNVVWLDDYVGHVLPAVNVPSISPVILSRWLYKCYLYNTKTEKTNGAKSYHFPPATVWWCYCFKYFRCRESSSQISFWKKKKRDQELICWRVLSL